jgi:hypothetical protein
MTPRIRFFGLVALLAIAGLGLPKCAFGQKANSSTNPANKVLAHQLDIATGRVKKQQYEQVVSSGTIYTLLLASGAVDSRAHAVSPTNSVLHTPASASGGCPNRYVGPISNTRVNQDCSLRRQAEEVIVVNPTNPKNLIAGQNDSRIGFNHCGYDFSFDSGKTWADQIPPFYQFIGGDGHTFDACSDPTATFDNAGNAYVGGILFDVAAVPTAIVVAKSNAGIGGAFYHTPANVSFQTYRDSPLGVVTSDNNPNVADDKELIIADAGASSPKKNNVYATWTRFAFTGLGVGVDSPIYFSQSTDGGATWSAGIEISGANSGFCTFGSAEANPAACDQDQGSDPIVGPDGTIYVSFFNGNTPTLGVNQHMIVSCTGTADCSNVANWTTPAQIVTDVGVQPFGPNAVTGCPAGRQCLPPNGYRIDDATFGSLSVDNNGTVYHVFSDFRNGVGGTCTFFVANPAPPCDQDVFYSFSKDGGATWSALFRLTPAGSAQWMPWGAVVPDGSRLYVTYYDRSYGCEFTGCNDITLATISNPTAATPSISYTRVTTSSMPNLVNANNPIQSGFLGDYMWVAVGNMGRANVVWADTRGLNGTVEEDIYFAAVP